MKRTCAVIADLELIPHGEKWPGLRAISPRVDSEVYFKATGKSTSMACYFITTMQPQAKLIGAAARAHWSIEKGLHWQLEVSYREDACRKRKDHAAINFSTLTKMTLTMLKRNTSTKVGVKSKRSRPVGITTISSKF